MDWPELIAETRSLMESACLLRGRPVPRVSDKRIGRLLGRELRGCGDPLAGAPLRESEDSSGHEHKGKGPGGGQFTGAGDGGGEGKGQDRAARREKARAREEAREAAYRKKAEEIRAKIDPAHAAVVKDAITRLLPRFERKARFGGADESAVPVGPLLDELHRRGLLDARRAYPARVYQLLDRMVFVGDLVKVTEGTGDVLGGRMKVSYGFPASPVGKGRPAVAPVPPSALARYHHSALGYVADNGPATPGELAAHLTDRHRLGAAKARAVVDHLAAAGDLARAKDEYGRDVLDRPGSGTPAPRPAPQAAPPRPAAGDPEDRVLDFAAHAGDHPGGLAPVWELRRSLGLPPDDFKALLFRLRREGKIRLIAVGDQSRLTHEQLRDSIQGENERFAYVEPRQPEDRHSA